MERDLAEMRGQQATVERAKALLESLGSPMQSPLLLTSESSAAQT
jgi:hypothetical protein